MAGAFHTASVGKAQAVRPSAFTGRSTEALCVFAQSHKFLSGAAVAASGHSAGYTVSIKVDCLGLHRSPLASQIISD